MTAMTTSPFTAARVQGRYRVLDEAGQIVVTLNSKAKAEARAAELNAAATTVAEADTMAEIDAALAVLDGATEERAQIEDAEDAELLAQVEADAAMERAMDAECPQEEEEITEADLELARAVNAAMIAPRESDAVPAAEERQDAPEGDAGTSDTPPAPAKPEKPAKAVKPKADQPAPHAFTTVGTTIKNHCTECGRSWAAAAHRKFRETQEGTEVAAEGEWTPAPDDTTTTGEAPALDGKATDA